MKKLLLVELTLSAASQTDRSFLIFESMKKIIIFFLAASFIQCFEAQASNRVKIVTIGGGFGGVYIGDSYSRWIGGFNTIPAESDRNNYQKLVDTMIEYWKREINKTLHQQPDLIVLTEVCDDPLGLNRQERDEYYRVRGNQIWDFFASVAKENRCYIAFGTKREEKGRWYNSCVILDREGKLAGIYNKNYPIVPEMDNGITPSDETPIIQCDFGRVGCVICFDLNFDELRDKYAALKPDLMIFISQWHGGLEQAKWAYTCRSYFVCSYSFRTFPSEIRNPLGEVVARSYHDDNFAVATVNLDRQIVTQIQKSGKLAALKKKYGDKVMVTFDDQLGVQMITSEHESVSAADMAKEFDIELTDNLLNRARQIRSEHL
jgi:hypothetical protein